MIGVESELCDRWRVSCVIVWGVSCVIGVESELCDRCGG